MSLHVEAPSGGETLLEERDITLLEQLNKKQQQKFSTFYTGIIALFLDNL